MVHRLRSFPLNFFEIAIYDLLPTYSLFLLFHDCAFEYGLIDHFAFALYDSTNIDKMCD